MGKLWRMGVPVGTAVGLAGSGGGVALGDTAVGGAKGTPYGGGALESVLWGGSTVLWVVGDPGGTVLWGWW